jgi:outer membrane protein OmpA-like peptidoglycan-associated protein
VKKLNLLFLIILLFTCKVLAQDTLRTRYGLMGGLNANTYNADFRAIPGVPNCCPLFSSGSGRGVAGGLLYDIPFDADFFYGLQLNYTDHSAELSALEGTTVIVNGKSQATTFTHTIDAMVTSLGLEPEIGVKIWNIVGSIGLRIGTILTANFSQQEVTSIGTFTDSLGNDTHSSIRNKYAAKLPNPSSLLFHGIASIGYELPVNTSHSTFLVPQISYSLAFNDAVKNLTWKMNAFTFGIAMKFSPIPTLPKMHVFDTLIVRDTTTKFVDGLTASRVTLTDTRFEHSRKEGDIISDLTTVHEIYLNETPNPHSMSASIQAVGLDEDGNETPMATLQIEEFLQFHAHPLLGYIFFGRNESNLPSKYAQITKEQTVDYELNNLFGLDDIEVNHNILNILGKRLREYSNANIIITGCNNDVDSEKDNLNLSKSRAETIKNYLVTVWTINPSRIKTEGRGLPGIPSTNKSEDGREENSRAEITSDVPEVTDVFVANDTTRIATPPEIRFKLKTTTASPIKKFELIIYQNDIPLHGFEGENIDLVDHVDWDLTNHQNKMPRFNTPLRIKLSLENILGDKKIIETTLPTQIRTVAQKKLEHASDVIIDRFNLVLFNFGKSDITREHERILTSLRSRLKPTSQITIEGYTDRTGTPTSNLRLATSRAQATADALGRDDAKVIGIGDRRLLFPNLSPEGRFFCRTVQITVKTPTN